MIVNVEPNKGANMPEVPAVDAPAELKQSFVDKHFAVLIVFLVFMLLLAVYLVELHWTANDSVTLWLQNKMSDLLSAMLMGLTGAAIAAKKS